MPIMDDAAPSVPSRRRKILIRTTLIAILVLLVIPAIVAGSLYIGDYGVEATVKETHCHLVPPNVVVETKAFSILTTQEIPDQSCAIIDEGNFVVYHIRSQHTILYEKEGGRCLYDSEKGHLCGQISGFLF